MTPKCGLALCVVLLTAVLMSSVSSALAGTLLVPEVYLTICDAVAVAGTGDVISIAPGTYRESCTVDIDGVIIESRLQEATTDTTIITGLDADLVTHRPWVFFVTGGTGPTTEIRYLTITGTDSSTGPAGGIVVDSGSDVTIRDNTITGNDNGGLSGESAGGVCCCSGSSATIRNNTITDNYGYWGGGAVYCGDGSTVVIEDNVLDMNSSRYDGAVSCDGAAHVLIQRNEIVGNCNSSSYSAGIYMDDAACDILGNYIAENDTGASDGRGGGIGVQYGSTAFIANNIIANNTAGANGSGGGIYVDGFGTKANATIINNTIYGNEAGKEDDSGSAIYIGDTTNTVIIKNNIAAHNLLGTAFSIWNPDAVSDYNDLWNNPSDYEGVIGAGPHDIAADPAFLTFPPVLPTDFDLQPTSPCIDAGTNDGAPDDDYLQRPRPRDGDLDSVSITDIGAFELQSLVPAVLLEVHPNERGPGPTAVNLMSGMDYWVWPALTLSTPYPWKQYDFAGSANLWIQVCAQNFSAFQNSQNASLAQEDVLRMTIDGITPPDVWGIQSGPPGSHQWKGSTEKGNRITLEFLVTGLTPGPHALAFQATMSPIIYWVKVYDLEARSTG